jgi:bifunctional non-homologous end joining protein LigD
MQTEDHPFDYGMFEGVIPEGYGAGIVLLWDYGTWEPETDDVDASMKKGDLKFRLNGFKLKGSWVLVKTRGFGGAPNSWLLIKHKDEWAGPIDIVEFAPLSVKTPNADFAEILSGETPDLWHSNAPAKGGDTGAMFKKIIERALSMKATPQVNAKDTKNTKTTASKPKAKAAKKARTKTAKR